MSTYESIEEEHGSYYPEGSSNLLLAQQVGQEILPRPVDNQTLLGWQDERMIQRAIAEVCKGDGTWYPNETPISPEQIRDLAFALSVSTGAGALLGRLVASNIAEHRAQDCWEDDDLPDTARTKVTEAWTAAYARSPQPVADQEGHSYHDYFPEEEVIDNSVAAADLDAALQALGTWLDDEEDDLPTYNEETDQYSDEEPTDPTAPPVINGVSDPYAVEISD